MSSFRPARAAATLALAAALPMTGCDNTVTTTMPSNPPPIPTDAKGKPIPPPTAAGAAYDATNPGRSKAGK